MEDRETTADRPGFPNMEEARRRLKKHIDYTTKPKHPIDYITKKEIITSLEPKSSIKKPYSAIPQPRPEGKPKA